MKEYFLLLSVALIITTPIAHADHRWSDVIERALSNNATDIQIKKLGQAWDAKQYQKKVLNFDYEKIQNFDKGFKGPVITDVPPKKTIQKIVFLS